MTKEYDANNNIIRKVVTENGVKSTKNYVYNAANRLEDHYIKDANGNTTFASVFYYDANGNLTQQYCNDTTSKYYSYDAWNRLTGYTSRDEVSTTYTYNGNNRRTSKTTGTTTTNYYWDRDYVAMEATGETTVSNFITPFGIMGRTTDAGYTFYFRDIHGDVVTAFDSYDDRKNYSYDAFGIEKTPDGTDTNPIRYSGEYYDSESGLIYLRNRYYDPEMGRFINEDPIEDGLNWYAYCGNNPVKYVDPLGYSKEGDERFSQSVRDEIAIFGQIWTDADAAYSLGIIDLAEKNAVQEYAEGQADAIRYRADHPVKTFLSSAVEFAVFDIVLGDLNMGSVYAADLSGPAIQKMYGNAENLEAIITTSATIVGATIATSDKGRNLINTKINGKMTRVDIEFPQGGKSANLHVQIDGVDGRTIIRSMDDLDRLPKSIRKSTKIVNTIKKGLKLLGKLI